MSFSVYTHKKKYLLNFCDVFMPVACGGDPYIKATKGETNHDDCLINGVSD
jgi:hypothetical protein